MKKPTLPAIWKQSRFNTCGPACLMTALHELGKCDLSRKMEMKIWDQARHAFFMGSIPAYLAAYAAAQGLRVTLFHKDCAPPGMKIQLHKPRRTLHRHLLRTYHATTMESRTNGLKTEVYQDEEAIVDRILGNSNQRVIYLVIDDDGYLHFILARQRRGSVLVMDPYFGRNTAYDKYGFLGQFKRGMVGYAISMEG